MATAHNADEWTCEACTMSNPNITSSCLTCSTPRIGSDPPWTCSACTMRNDPSSAICSVCGTPGGVGNGAVTVASALSADDDDTPMNSAASSADASKEAKGERDWYDVVWGTNPPTENWMNQSLSFTDSKCEDNPEFTTRLALHQPKNGPCGALAAYQAVALGLVDLPSRADPNLDERDLMVETIVSILIQAGGGAGSGGLYRVAAWENPSSPEANKIVISDSSTREELHSVVSTHAEQFEKPGGVCLLVYSAVLTRTVPRVVRDVQSSGGEPPLVQQPFSLCSSDLVMLLLRGVADGNVGAYVAHPGGDLGQKVSWKTDVGVGLLSLDEVDTGVPLADCLVSPEKECWVLHGGDHFTVAWVPKPKEAGSGETKADKDYTMDTTDDASDASKETEPFTVLHWNGLPPAGPRLSALTVTAPSGSRPPASSTHTPTYYKPVPGEIESVVQAHPDDKKSRPYQYHTWRYEIQLAFDDPDVRGGPRPPDMAPPPLFEQGKIPTDETSWRCARCYSSRYETMCFGINDKTATSCQHCNKPREEVGWTIWMKYDDLPGGTKSSCGRLHAPKIVTLLQAKWPGAKVEYDDKKNPPAV